MKNNTFWFVRLKGAPTLTVVRVLSSTKKVISLQLTQYGYPSHHEIKDIKFIEETDGWKLNSPKQRNKSHCVNLKERNDGCKRL